MLEKHLGNSFLLYLVVEIFSFLEVLYKRSVLKNFSKFTDKHKRTAIRRYSVKRKDVLKNFGKFSEKRFCRSLLFKKVAGCKPETFRSSHWRCSVKEDALKNFANFTGNNLCWSLFLIKLQFWGPATLLKKTLKPVFSSEICNYFEENLSMFTSKLY